jgi:hypothetical protein
LAAAATWASANVRPFSITILCASQLCQSAPGSEAHQPHCDDNVGIPCGLRELEISRPRIEHDLPPARAYIRSAASRVHRACALLAFSGHELLHRTCPLSEVKHFRGERGHHAGRRLRYVSSNIRTAKRAAVVWGDTPGGLFSSTRLRSSSARAYRDAARSGFLPPGAP